MSLLQLLLCWHIRYSGAMSMRRVICVFLSPKLFIFDRSKLVKRILILPPHPQKNWNRTSYYIVVENACVFDFSLDLLKWAWMGNDWLRLVFEFVFCIGKKRISLNDSNHSKAKCEKINNVRVRSIYLILFSMMHFLIEVVCAFNHFTFSLHYLSIIVRNCKMPI